MEINLVEVILIFVHLIVAVVIGLFAWGVERLMKRIETSHWLNQKIIEQRLQIYNEVMPKLNDLLCYYTYVGNWKELTPTQIITLKRELDKTMYVSKPLFSDNFFANYLAFMELCFKTFVGIGEDAKLRTGVEKRRDNLVGHDWLPEDDQKFFPEERPSKDEIRKAYENLAVSFSKELGLKK